MLRRRGSNSVKCATEMREEAFERFSSDVVRVDPALMQGVFESADHQGRGPSMSG